VPSPCSKSARLRATLGGPPFFVLWRLRAWVVMVGANPPVLELQTVVEVLGGSGVDATGVAGAVWSEASSGDSCGPGGACSCCRAIEGGGGGGSSGGRVVVDWPAVGSSGRGWRGVGGGLRGSWLTVSGWYRCWL